MLRSFSTFYFMSLLAFAMDQLTKWQARSVLAGGATFEFIKGKMWAVLAFNPHGAMSMGEHSGLPLRPILITACVLGIVLMAWWVRKPEFNSPVGRFGLALMCGGGLGTLWDHIFDARGVTDFLAVGRGVPEGGIFNLADLWIVAGAVLVLTCLATYKGRCSLSERSQPAASLRASLSHVPSKPPCASARR